MLKTSAFKSKIKNKKERKRGKPFHSHKKKLMLIKYENEIKINQGIK